MEFETADAKVGSRIMDVSIIADSENNAFARNNLPQSYSSQIKENPEKHGGTKGGDGSPTWNLQSFRSSIL